MHIRYSATQGSWTKVDKVATQLTKKAGQQQPKVSAGRGEGKGIALPLRRSPRKLQKTTVSSADPIKHHKSLDISAEMVQGNYII